MSKVLATQVLRPEFKSPEAHKDGHSETHNPSVPMTRYGEETGESLEVSSS